MQRTLKRELKVLEVVERETKVTPKKTGDPFTWVTHNKKLWLSFAGGSRFGLARGNSARFFFLFFQKSVFNFLQKRTFGLLRVHFSLSGQVSISCVKIFSSFFFFERERERRLECDKKLSG